MRRTGKNLRQFKVGRFPSVIFSPDGKTLAVLDLGAGDNQALRLRNAMSGAELQELRGHQDQIHQVVFSQDGKTLISTGDDKTIRFWDATTGKESRKLDCPEPILKMAVSPDSHTLALVYGKKTDQKNAQSQLSFGWQSRRCIYGTRRRQGNAPPERTGQEPRLTASVFAPDGERSGPAIFKASAPGTCGQERKSVSRWRPHS